MNQIIYFLIASFLFLLRSFTDYRILSISIPLILLIIVFFSISKGKDYFLIAILSLPFFELFEVFNNSPPISIPYVALSIFILFTYLNYYKSINLYLFFQISFITILALLSLILNAFKIEILFYIFKLSISSMLILLASRIDMSCLIKMPKNIFYNKLVRYIKIIFSILLYFFFIEFISANIFPGLRDNILVGHDWRPIGFMSEPTYISFYLLIIAINYFYVVGLTKEFFVSLFALAINLSRTSFPSLLFSLFFVNTLKINGLYISKKLFKNILIFIVSLLMIYSLFIFILNVSTNKYILENLDYKRFVQFFDSGRLSRYDDFKELFTSMGNTLFIQSYYQKINSTGVYLMQLLGSFGSIFGTFIFLIISFNLILYFGYIGTILILSTFFHPFQFSSILLLCLIIQSTLRSLNSVLIKELA